MKDSFRDQARYLGEHLRPHKRVLIFSFSLSAVSTALGMIQPYFAKILIDEVLLNRDYRSLVLLLTGLIFLLIVSFVIRVGNSYLYTLYSAKILFRMREELFDHLHRVPLIFLSRNKLGDLYSRIASDMADVQGMVTETIPHCFFNLLTCLMTAGILFWLNWKMALMSFIFLPAGLYVIHRMRPKLMEMGKEMAEYNADIAHFLFESLSGSALVRTFAAEKSEREKLEGKQSYVLNVLLRYQVLGAFSGLIPTVFTIINTLVVFGYGGVLAMKGTLSIGSLVAFSIYQGRVFGPLQGLMDGFLSLQKSRVSLNRVREILDIEPAFSSNGNFIPETEELRGEMVFEGVSFAYENKEPVLKDLSFCIPSGMLTALIGPSGVGKTTVCHLMLRLFDPGCGRITLDGIDLREYKTDWLRRQMAIVSQDIFLFHASILENIRFSNPQAGDEAVVDAAQRACIHEFIHSLPNGYHTVVGDRGVRLSGGQKQRISIARSLLLKPQILIMDEATAFLDVSAEERLKETVGSLMQHRTTLVVSHRFSTIRNAQKIIVMEKEGLVYEGPSAAFFNDFHPELNSAGFNRTAST